MSFAATVALIIIYFLTAVISVAAGGTSLITVPALMQCGVEPRVAVATNMLALFFLSLGGTIPFLRGESIRRDCLPRLVGITLIGSALGSALLLVVPLRAMPLVIAGAMLAVATFSILHRDPGVASFNESRHAPSALVSYIATFVLGIYGGFFSGGYVALLTAAFVGFFRMRYVEAIATTKVLNAASCSIACIIFAIRGLIEWRLGFLLGAAGFAGGLVGSSLTSRIGDLWLRRIFLATVVSLAVKILVFDVILTPR